LDGFNLSSMVKLYYAIKVLRITLLFNTSCHMIAKLSFKGGILRLI